MEVILLERLRRLGDVGDVVRVKDGYARNFLLPRGKALRATNENKRVFEEKRSEIEKENADRRVAAEKIAAALEGVFVVLIRQAGDDGRLYGSVAARDVAVAIAESKEAKNTAIDKSQILIHKPIKGIGVYPLKIQLHPEVVAEIRVNVARSEAEAKDAKEIFLNPEMKKQKQVDAAMTEAESTQVATGETPPEAIEPKAEAAS